jgi:hypothetical protein
MQASATGAGDIRNCQCRLGGLLKTMKALYVSEINVSTPATPFFRR